MEKDAIGIFFVSIIFLFLILSIIGVSDLENGNGIEEKTEKEITVEEDSENDDVEEIKNNSSNSIDEKIDEDILPNIAEAPCGYYYEEYGICEGVCPDGRCVEKEGSCYCQET